MTGEKPIYIIKFDGSKELFDKTKLEKSLRKIGTEPETVKVIIQQIQSKLKNGDTTKKIYKQAFNLLRKHQRPVALRYSLRKAVSELGPSGFPFERFIAEIFKEKGYQAVTGQIVLGACVPHEVDVVAWTDTELIMIEAKFHADYGTRSDLKVALYIKARFDDLKNNTYRYGLPAHSTQPGRHITTGMLITNTKFSSTAIQYGECVKLDMVGWNYPKRNNLHQLIEKMNLIPLTVLTTISQNEKKMFLANNIVLCKTLNNVELLKTYNFDDLKIANLVEEITSLLDINKDEPVL